MKSFKALNYEGSQSKIDENLQDGQYYNLKDKRGWYVSHIETDLEKGSLNEFIEKEGKWFNYIKGKEGAVTDNGIVISDFNNSDTSFQGIGRIAGDPSASSLPPPTTPTEDIVLGCTDSQSESYDENATTDDGSCNYPGCTDPSAFNYNENANENDGSCVSVVNGCTDSSMFNYDGAANTDDGSCVAIITGCIDPTADNYNGTANTDDGGCTYPPVYGCTDANACNYDIGANTDDNSCGYCGDNTADNYSANAAGICTDNCEYCLFWDDSLESYTTGNGSTIVNDSATSLDIAWSNSTGTAPIVSFDVRYSVSGLDTWTTISVPNNASIWYQTYTIQGLTQSTTYDIQVRKVCNNTASEFSPILNLTTQFAEILGCIDPNACNPTAGANTDDGSCDYTACAGCMDATAFNYDETATIDDGGCVAMLNGCTDGTAFNYDANANTDDGSCIAVVNGCTDASSCDYDSTANTDDGSCIGACSSYIDYINVTGSFVNDPTLGVYNTQVTVGWNTLTNPDASTNHRMRYKKALGSWTTISGLSAGSGSTVINDIFEENENYYFQVKAVCVGSGCNQTWSDSDWTNIGAFYGCTDAGADNYVDGASVDDGSCIYTTTGCMYGLAINYDPTANANQLSLCTWPAQVLGCVYVNADNYDSSATHDDGSCVFTTTVTLGCMDPAYAEYSPNNTQDYNLSDCLTVINPGCTDDTQFNYDFNAVNDNGSCDPFTYGCTNSSASNYNVTVNTSDGSCIWLGCTDAAATNYNPTATVDDGTCTY